MLLPPLSDSLYPINDFECWCSLYKKRDQTILPFQPQFGYVDFRDATLWILIGNLILFFFPDCFYLLNK